MKNNFRKVLFSTQKTILIIFCVFFISIKITKAQYCSCSKNTDMTSYVEHKLKEKGLNNFSKEIIQIGLSEIPMDSNGNVSYGDIFSLSMGICNSSECIKESKYKESLKNILNIISSSVVKESLKYATGSKIIFIPADLMKAWMLDLINSIAKEDIDAQIRGYFKAQEKCSKNGEVSIDTCHRYILECSAAAQRGQLFCPEIDASWYMDSNAAGFLLEVDGDRANFSIYPENVTPKDVFSVAKILYEIEIAKKDTKVIEEENNFIKEFTDVLEKQPTKTSSNQNIFSKLLSWIGDGVKKVWSGVKNTIQKIGEAVKKPFTKNSENPQPALISEPLKQKEDKNEPQKIEEQKESISPAKEAEKKQDTASKPAEAATPSVYKNPFQDLYDFYPKGSEFQECIKKILGNNFLSVYDGYSVPTKEDLNPAQLCFNIKNYSDLYIKFIPESVQKCMGNTFSRDFEEILINPYFQTSPEFEENMQKCSVLQEWLAKIEAFGQYIKSNNVTPPTVPPTTPEKEALPPKISIAPINIDAPATAGSVNFNITANDSVFRYGVVVSEDWSWLSAKFSVNKDTGKTEGPITATYAANNSSSPRIGKLTITAEGATGIPAIGSPVILTITQAAAQDLVDTKLYTITATFVDGQGNNIKERLFFGMRNLATNDYGFGRSIDGGEFYYQLKNGEYRFSVFQSGENANYADYSATITIDHKDLDLGIIPVRLIQQVLP